MEFFWLLVLLVFGVMLLAGMMLWRQQNQRAAATLRNTHAERLAEMPTKRSPD